jgi:hypothetical protein
VSRLGFELSEKLQLEISMDGWIDAWSSKRCESGWLAGWSGASALQYGLAFVLQRLCSTVHVCIPDDSGVTANIQVYKSEWSCHRGYSIPVEAVSCVPCEYIHHMSCPTVDELVRESIKAGYTYIEMTTTT